jgi:hypothetical protein
MFLSRAKAVKNAAAAAAASAQQSGTASSATNSAASDSAQKIPDLEHFLEQRDFLGAVTLLSVRVFSVVFSSNIFCRFAFLSVIVRHFFLMVFCRSQLHIVC